MSTQANQPAISCTPAAVKRIHELVSLEGNPNLKLRVYITGGGCSGFQYGFGFDEKLRPDDAVIPQEPSETEGGQTSGTLIQVVVDAVSLMYLNGAEIDYVENLRGSHFTVKNPNAQTTCSCGSSFSL